MADSYVSDNSTAPQGSAGVLYVDTSPNRRSFLRFDVTGLAGRTVVGARLRMRQTDRSQIGGRVWGVSNTSWSESVTWADQPALDGPLLASIGSVSKDVWYDIGLAGWTPADGPVAFGMDSTSNNGASWASRESTNPPRLLIEVHRIEGLVIDGTSQIANKFNGSSEPTFWGSNARVAVTQTGRTLAIFGSHGQGVQLAWRDPGGGWLTSTTGAVDGGALLAGTGTGDWPGSIVVGDDGTGVERAWAVFSGQDAAKTKALYLRRLSNLDARGGPTVGPLVTLDASGNAFADIALDGAGRAAVTWLDLQLDGTAVTKVGWITDLGTDTPTLSSVASVIAPAEGAATLSRAPDGMRLVAENLGALVFARNPAAAPLTSWSIDPATSPVNADARPSAIALASGELLVAADDADDVHVVRLNADGTTASIEVDTDGRQHGSLSGDGTSAVLLAVNAGRTQVLSRTFDGSSWSSETVEMAQSGAGFAWPSSSRTLGTRIRLIVQGPSGSSTQRSVLAFQRLR